MKTFLTTVLLLLQIIKPIRLILRAVMQRRKKTRDAKFLGFFLFLFFHRGVRSPDFSYSFCIRQGWKLPAVGVRDSQSPAPGLTVWHDVQVLHSKCFKKKKKSSYKHFNVSMQSEILHVKTTVWIPCSIFDVWRGFLSAEHNFLTSSLLLLWR